MLLNVRIVRKRYVMQNVSSARQGARRILPVAAGLLVAVLLLASPAFGQQEYVGRFDAFAGFTYLNSPHVSLAEKGSTVTGPSLIG